MTDKMKTTIEIPMPILAIMVTILLTIFGWAIATASSSASTKKQVEVNTNVIKDIQYNKADKSSFDYIKEQLDELKKSTNRIETKVDRHIENSKIK